MSNNQSTWHSEEAMVSDWS